LSGIGSHPPVSPLLAAVKGRCPRCGEGKLFAGLLSLVSRCGSCGLDLSGQDVGDGPVAFVVLILGATTVGLAILLEVLVAPPMWLQLAIWTPVILGGSILLLRVFKAWLVAQQFRHRALGSVASR